MKSLNTRKGGFTLIELMIVVAIIGILAAIAIPNFLRFQLRAKSSEGKVNLAAIRTAQEGYFSEFGTYVLAATSPAGALGTAKIPWIDNGAVGSNFDTMGWSPEGDVYFDYTATAGTVGAGTGLNEFFGHATADLDGDGVLQEWAYVKPVAGAAGTTGLAIGGCNNAGTWNASAAPPAANLLTTVGPCDPLSSQSVF